MSLNLSNIKIEGYKSIKSLDLTMKPINVLIGANGSGKTNFITVFQFLNIIYQRKLQNYVAKNGGAERFLHFGSKTTEKIFLKLSFHQDETRANYYEIELTKNSEDDVLLIELEQFFNKLASMNAIESNLRNHKSKVGNHVKDYLSNCKVYHFHDTSETAKFKSTQDIYDNDFLHSDAANLASFLYRLKKEFNPEYQQIIMAVQAVASFFHDFKFKVFNDNILLRWLHTNDLEGGGFSANSLSDGTARFICMATLLLQPKQLRPKTIVLDEPEIGLHPAALELLSEIIKSIADESQIIISTQSVTLANYFDKNDFIVVDQIDGVSKFSRLGDGDELETWLTKIESLN